MYEITIKEISRSKEEKIILTGKINGIEEYYYKARNENILCVIPFLYCTYTKLEIIK